MHLFSPIDSFDSPFDISRRQSNTGQSSECWGGLGAGDCRAGSECRGLIYENQCRQKAGDECCLNRQCTTDLGDGYCKNNDNQTCAGEWVPGSAGNYPCPGPGYIVCCVEYADMVNSTSLSTSASSTSSTTFTTSTTATGTPTTTQTEVSSDSNSGSGSGLSTATKGGIAGGIVGAVLVTSLFFLVFFFLRRRRQRGAARSEIGKDGTNERPLAGTAIEGQTQGMQIMGEDREGEGGDKGATMLASRALHEMESPTAETGAATAAEESDQGRNLEQVKKRRMAELPGSLGVVAELPIPQEGGQKFNEVD